MEFLLEIRKNPKDERNLIDNLSKLVPITTDPEERVDIFKNGGLKDFVALVFLSSHI